MEKVNVREFRNNIGKYMGQTSPFAITKYGQTVGYYIPAHPNPGETERLSLQKAASAFDAMLEEHGITEEELFQEFRQMRQNDATQ